MRFTVCLGTRRSPTIRCLPGDHPQLVGERLYRSPVRVTAHSLKLRYWGAKDRKVGSDIRNDPMRKRPFLTHGLLRTNFGKGVKPPHADLPLALAGLRNVV